MEQRKVITNGISHNYKLKDIAQSLGFDPTSISKEVKRNRESTTIGINVTNCKRINRWPYVCSGCNKKYNNKCCFKQYKYEAQQAQNKVDLNLVSSRKGIEITKEKFIELDLIKKTNQEKVVKFFDDIEEKIGIDAFIELIPVILTVRDPNFTDIEGICFSKTTGEERCK